jgi:hypothetical protein
VAQLTMTIIATDLGSPSLSSTANLTIYVTRVPCPAGSFSPTGSLLNCVPCSLGVTFQSFSNSTSCQPCACPLNTYQIGFCTLVSQSCAACPTQSSSSGTGTNVTSCTCNQGFYRTDPYSSVCTACLAGCYSGYFLSGNCTFTSTPICQLCTPSDMCIPRCNPGSYSFDGNEPCSLCLPGTWSSFRATSCSTCNQGTFSAVTGATSSNACMPVSVCNNVTNFLSAAATPSSDTICFTPVTVDDQLVWNSGFYARL